MKIPEMFNNSELFGIDPNSIEIGYCSPIDEDRLGAQLGTRRFIAQDWNRSGPFIQLGRVLETVENYLDRTSEGLTSFERTNLRKSVVGGHPEFMQHMARPIIDLLHQSGTSFGFEPYDPNRQYLFGPLVDAYIDDVPFLLEGVGLWGKFNPKVYTSNNGKPWVLYHQDGSLYR